MKKFTTEEIIDITSMYNKFIPLKEISIKYGVSRPTISKVLKDNLPEYKKGKRAAIASINQTKICKYCGIERPLKEYNKGNAKYGVRTICRKCEHIIQNTEEKRKKRRERRAERRLEEEYVKKERLKNINCILNSETSYLKYLIRTAKARALKNNIPFNISVEDLELPKICPLLEIPLEIGIGKKKDNLFNSPSIDRIIPSLGYIKGNVWIISYRANMIKSNASLEEIQLLYNNLKEKIM